MRLRAERDLLLLPLDPPRQRLDAQQADTVGVHRADGGLALAQAEGGMEVLRGGADVADGDVLAGVVPPAPAPCVSPRGGIDISRRRCGAYGETI